MLVKRALREYAKLTFIFSALVLFSSVAFAATNNCPNATSSSSVNNGTGAATVTIPGAGPNNSFSALGVSGCTAVDFAFTNFTGSFVGTPANGALTTAGAYLAETPAGTSSDPLLNPDTFTFASVRGAANVGTNGDNNDSLNNFDANNNNVVTDNLAFHVGSSGANPYSINAITLTVLQAAFGSAASGSITIDVCSGGQTGVIISAGACTGSFSTTTLTLGTLATQNITLALANLTNFNVTTVINLTGGNGNGNHAGFDAFSLGFTEVAPEPSTFVLLGTALVGVGFLRSRKRKA